MDNLNSALERIKKKKQVKEAVQIIPAIAKGVAVAGKAAAKIGSVGTKVAAKGTKVAAKGTKVAAKGAKATGDAAKGAAKGASNTSKPVARNLTKRRNVKNPKYKNPDGSFNKKLYDQDGNKKTQGYMSNIEKPTDNRANTHSGSQRQTSKVQDAEKRDKETRDREVQNKASELKKNTGDAIKKTAQVAGNTAKYAARKAKDAVSSTTSVYGTSSFNKEDYNYVEEYLKKL